MPLIAPPLSLYVHIPWCVRKCPYCDFNSHAQAGALPVEEYVRALLADLDRDLAAFGAALARRPLHSVFFGGGTPSLFPPEAIARVLDGVAARLELPRDAEVTLETNPGTVEHGRFDGYLAAGVNRLSLGVQSFDDDKLRRLGRIHSAGDAERAVRQAQDAGYADINLDLMYALPEQTLGGALDDVERALALEPTHVSHYQLTLEPNTLFAAKPPPLPDEDGAWDMQEACQVALADAGFAQYEVSAYARAGRRAKHNLNYWRFGDYLGIGAGAHGKLSDAAQGRIVRTTKVKLPRSYLDRAARRESFGTQADVAAIDLPFEFMMNALRLEEGVDAPLFGERTGLATATIAAPLARARQRGWMVEDPARLAATALGRRFLNDVIGSFLPEGPRAEG
ncbi:radical SAM family heme chaperone HemW [Dokdonella fugitiva]|jgi:oxygen-independent coproporphyrinogen-3 oxidase|uniref:Heme chaperone HemW n=1 Tax=Dokdonella fugitiva TaxID=328517 RepID=A0A4R2I1A9_9GAMM|nr:radical SAM family heme chaperone HemW [Dokdonella fugitiva]MBA8884683.1 oxygen-independent coproporphyrinogen-3 oxidase [Dokdonella fugitiva]TCO37734.1 oxygen-independent coproporphyrinogen-3 oxidase [Dokdonella fugitiva]